MATKHVVGFSGGIDSQACARWVLNRFPPDDVILLNSDVGGHEHPITTQFIADYSRDVHPVTVISPIVEDMAGRGKGKVAELKLSPEDPLTFDLAAKIKQSWPGRKFQWCTTHLKLYPQVRWMVENLEAHGVQWCRYSGKRREESAKRRNTGILEWDDVFACDLHHPIADWTKKMCFDYCQYHGEEVNPLYSLGFDRVGCAPCINSNKSDILNWATRFPEMIDKVRGWEKETGKPFFRHKDSNGELKWVDEVVDWAKTTHGGKQYSLLAVIEPESCDSNYGLCE